MHATTLSQICKQERDQGRGVSFPYARPQTLFFTTENPLDFSGEKNQTLKQIKPNNGSTKRAKQGLRG